MGSYSQTNVIGNLGPDIKIKSVGEHRICTFSIAVKSWRKKDEAQWFNIKCWDKSADWAYSNLSKGDVVQVVGEMISSKHEGKTYWNLEADTINGLRLKKWDAPKQDAGPTDGWSAAPASPEEDDYPF